MSHLEALKELWRAIASAVILIIRNFKQHNLHTTLKRYFHMKTYLKNTRNTGVKRELTIRWDYGVI
jgi:glucuronate isomerase